MEGYRLGTVNQHLSLTTSFWYQRWNGLQKQIFTIKPLQEKTKQKWFVTTHFCNQAFLRKKNKTTFANKIFSQKQKLVLIQ